MNEEKTAFQAFVSSLVTVVVFVLSYAGFTASTEETKVEKPAVVECRPDEAYALFQQKLKATGSAVKPEPVVKPVIQPTVEVTKPAAVVAGPVRVSGSRWNVEGNWNYSTADIARHLEQVHGTSAASYSKQQLEAMHDNLHNGYAAMGYSSAPKVTTTYSVPTKTYSQPVTYSSRTGLFGARRTYRTYSSSCPGGVCPQ